MRVIEKIDKTEEEALNSALKEANISKEDLFYHYEIVSKNNKSGFLGLGGKNVKINLYVYDEEEKSIIKIINEFFNIANFKISSLKILQHENDKIYINLESDEKSILIGRRGRVLKALQLLLNIIVNRKLGKNFQLILDISNWRERRVKVLQNLAKKLALKVRKERKPVLLEEMAPFERKVIHSTLQNLSDITTESIGEGYYKRVKIKLRNE